MSHFGGLIWTGPRFLVRNLFQNFGVNLKQILDFRVIFEKMCTLRSIFNEAISKFLSNNPLNLLLYILKFSIFGFTLPVVNLAFTSHVGRMTRPRLFHLDVTSSSTSPSSPPPPPRVFYQCHKMSFKYFPVQLLTGKNLIISLFLLYLSPFY